MRPERYELALVPDLDQLRFSGKVRIEIAVVTPTASITLNSDELALDEAVVDGQTHAAAIRLDPKRQRATLEFPQPVAAGSHELTIVYHGVIGKGTLVCRHGL